MKKSTLIMILSLVLAVALGVGGTLAYLQDTDEDVNVMTLGNVYITQNEQERDADGNLVPFTQEKPAYPAVYEGSSIPWAPADEWVVPNDQAWKVVEDNPQVIDKFVTVTNTGTAPAYVRTIFGIEVGKDAVNAPYMHLVYNGTNVTEVPSWNFAWAVEGEEDIMMDIDGSTYVFWVATYTDVLPAKATTIPSLKQIYLDKNATNEVVEAYGDTYTVLALSQAVQTAGFENSEVALNAAFGEVNAENIEMWFANIGKNVGTPGDKWPNNNPPSADVWDGTIPETMPETMELTLDAVKNQGGTITVNDAEALVYLSKLKDDFIAKAEEISGYDNYYYIWEWEIELTSDIDMNNIAIDPIDISKFGDFDGNGHTIKNVVVKDGGAGLFNGSTTYTDLTLSNVKINAPAAEKVGALAPTAGLIKNVTVMNAEIVGKKYVGGIVGKSSSVIDCTVQNAVITASDKTVGGMVGYAIGDPGTASAKNNVVDDVKVTGAYNVGGLFGQAQNIELENNTVKNTEVTSTTALPADAGETEKRVDEVAARQHGHYTETGSTVENVTVNEQ